MIPISERLLKSGTAPQAAPVFWFPKKITYFVSGSIEGEAGQDVVSLVLTLITSGYSLVVCVVDSREAAFLSRPCKIHAPNPKPRNLTEVKVLGRPSLPVKLLEPIASMRLAGP